MNTFIQSQQEHKNSANRTVPHTESLTSTKRDIYDDISNQSMQQQVRSCSIFPGRCPLGGACHTCPPRLQTKLTINTPGDKYEQEADRVADQVMRMPEPQVGLTISPQDPVIQRACPACDEEVQRQEEPEEEEEEAIQTKPLADQITPLVQRQEESEEEEETIQTKRNHSITPEIDSRLASQIQGLRGGGQPLPASARTFFEPRFGRDFSQVRIHANTEASQMAQSVNARAFTIGNHIAFNSGQFMPDSNTGRHLLAHELSHVIQQRHDPHNSRLNTDGANNYQPGKRQTNQATKNIMTKRGRPALTANAPYSLYRSGAASIVGEIVRGYIGYRCLQPLFPQMRRESRTFIRNYCRTLPRTETVLRQQPHAMAPRATRVTLRGVPSNYYDAFGHCWIACAGSRRCGRGVTRTLGNAREIWRELDEDPHDSFSQDVNNQSHGRSLSTEQGSCLSLCQQAVIDRRLDLSAPTRHCVDCARSTGTRVQFTSRCGSAVQVTPGQGQQGTGWLPRSDQ